MPVTKRGRALPAYLLAPILVLSGGFPAFAADDDDTATLIVRLDDGADTPGAAPAAFPFAAYRNVIQGLFAGAEYNKKTCALISAGKMTATVAPKHGKVGSVPYQVTETAGPCVGKTYLGVLATYTWTDNSPTGTIDNFTANWSTPDKNYSESKAYTAVLLPTVTGPAELWWFNGETPAGYDTEITLTAQPPGLTKYTWTVTKGANLVKLDGKASPIVTATNTIKVTGAGASKAKNDVEITVTVAGGVSTPLKLTVKAPASLKPLKDVDAVDPGFAYVTNVHYAILDNFGTVLPNNVPLNEKFTTPVVNDFKGADWRRGPEGGANVKPSDWSDVIQGEAPGHKPKPLAPQTPLSAVKVDHWDGGWQIGSATIGKGRAVQTNVWQKYEDHARHEGIKSPPAAAP